MMTTIPWDLLGFRLAGDIGDLTIYTDKNYKKVVYPFSPPHKPPSALQIAVRLRFRTAMANWKALSDQEKWNLEDAARAVSLVMGGVALFVSAQTTGRNTALQTIARQTGIPLPEAPDLRTLGA